MRLYINKNNPNEFQIGASFPEAILCPEHIKLEDLAFLTVEEVVTIVEKVVSPEVVEENVQVIETIISPEVRDENNIVIQEAVIQTEEVITYNVVQEAVIQTEEVITHNFIVNEQAKLTQAAVKNKEAQITAAYNQMNDLVYGEMLNVFNTSKSDSATAFHETWKLMKEKPELFINKVVVDKAVSGYVLGQVLSVAQDIVNYANARIALAETYAIFRLDKINEFYAQRAQILGE